MVVEVTDEDFFSVVARRPEAAIAHTISTDGNYKDEVTGRILADHVHGHKLMMGRRKVGLVVCTMCKDNPERYVLHLLSKQFVYSRQLLNKFIMTLSSMVDVCRRSRSPGARVVLMSARDPVFEELGPDVALGAIRQVLGQDLSISFTVCG